MFVNCTISHVSQFRWRQSEIRADDENEENEGRRLKKEMKNENGTAFTAGSSMRMR